MSTIWRHIRSLLRKDQNVVIDSSMSTAKYQENDDIALLQDMIRRFSICGTETFVSTAILLIRKLCLAENYNTIFLYIRTTLEVFILYSIETSDFAWICDKRAAYIGEQTELMLATSFPTVSHSLSHQHSTKDCLRMATLLEMRSRCEHYQAEIIKNLVEIVDNLSLNGSIKVYDCNNSLHRLNSVVFLQTLKPHGRNWIAMAYYLATEDAVPDNTLPRYND